MRFFFLANTLLMAGLIVGGFALLTVLIEALVMFLFKMNRFSKCLGDSLMANVGSFLLGVLIFMIFSHEEFDQTVVFIAFFFITCIFEAWIIKLLNRSLSWKKILPASFLMNLPASITIYLFLTLEISI